MNDDLALVRAAAYGCTGCPHLRGCGCGDDPPPCCAASDRITERMERLEAYLAADIEWHRASDLLPPPPPASSNAASVSDAVIARNNADVARTEALAALEER